MPLPSAFDWTAPFAKVVSDNVESVASFIVSLARPPHKPIAKPLNLQSRDHRSLLQTSLAASLSHGFAFDPATGEAWPQFYEAIETLGEQMQRQKRFKIGGLGGGNGFRLRQRDYGLTTHTFGIASDTNMRKLDAWQKNVKAAAGDEAYHFCKNARGAICWEVSTHIGARMDANAPEPYSHNLLNLHDDDAAQHEHGSTPQCRCSMEQGKLAVDMVGPSGRISWWTVDGNSGRQTIKLGTDALNKKADEKNTIWCTSIHHDSLYRRIFDQPCDSPFVHAGQFAIGNGYETDLQVLCCRAWPMAVVLNLDPSTIDSFGSRPDLRQAKVNRYNASRALFGKPWGRLAGAQDSISATLSTSATMQKVEMHLKNEGLMLPSDKMRVPGAQPVRLASSTVYAQCVLHECGSPSTSLFPCYRMPI